MNLTIERSCLTIYFLKSDIKFLNTFRVDDLTVLARSYLSWNQSIRLIDLSLHRYGYFLWRGLAIAAVAALLLYGSVGVAIPWIVDNSFLITVCPYARVVCS